VPLGCGVAQGVSGDRRHNARVTAVNPNTVEHSIWLLARADQHAALQQRIRALAPHHDAHVFEPHVTLQGDLALDAASARRLVDRLASQTPVLQWPVRAVESTDHYFRSLYLRLEGGDRFERLIDACAQASGTRAGASPYAHLSLAYGPTRGDAPALRQALSDEFGTQTLVLDRVALCRSSSSVAIADWQLLHVQPLCGA
jgi:Cyclic phosphodiesterase-like protein